MPTNLDETELARLEELACAAGDADYSAHDDADDSTKYAAAACNSVPALVAEVRRLRKRNERLRVGLNTKHLAFKIADAWCQRQDVREDALIEKVEAWEWCNQVQHIYDNISFVLGLRQCAINELYTTLTAAREAVHADRE